ncbi:MAG: DUF488 domain-containing protein [Chloroflexota bacterium]|nr:MAG: DUF488 domain-containing protein [Chloroflexota bacterium]
MQPKQAPFDIFTIGHSNVPVEKMVALLRQHGIRTLVDVRSVPYAQYATQFNREMLHHTLDEAGIEYLFAGDYLGGRPKDRTCYVKVAAPKGNDGETERVDYAEVAKRPWYQKGLARLVEIARQRRTAIVCSEEDPSRCHRHNLITQSLLAIDATVWHIRGTGDLERARSKAEEQLEKSRQPYQLNLF